MVFESVRTFLRNLKEFRCHLLLWQTSERRSWRIIAIYHSLCSLFHFFCILSLLFFNSSCFMEQMVVEFLSQKQPALLIIIPLFWYLPCYVLYVFDHHWNAIFGRKSLDDRGLHSSHIFAAWPTMLSRPPLLALFSATDNFI